jgi:PRTRC genetic system ThiF family protein
MENLKKYVLRDIHQTKILVAGCGGTGSMLLQELARINHALIKLGKKGIKVAAMDPDVVTEANFGRQLFNEQDIGRNKAEVTIERINRFYGYKWESSPNLFSEKSYREYPNLIITCTDRIKPRIFADSLLAMNPHYIEQNRLFGWLDTGNDKETGQVLLKAENTKSIFDFNPDLKTKVDRKNRNSCSLAEALERQDLMINKFVALVAGKLVWSLFNDNKTDWYGAFINSKTLKIQKLWYSQKSK